METEVEKRLLNQFQELAELAKTVRNEKLRHKLVEFMKTYRDYTLQLRNAMNVLASCLSPIQTLAEKYRETVWINES